MLCQYVRSAPLGLDQLGAAVMVRRQPRLDDSERAEFLLLWLQTMRDRERKTKPRHDTRTSLVEFKNASV
jgi:hypothetical protein